MNDPDAPGKGQRERNETLNEPPYMNVFEQIKNAPGKDFAGFYPAASFISPEYRKLNDEERQEIFQAVLHSRAANADDNEKEIIFWFDANNGSRLKNGNLNWLYRTEKRVTEKLLLSAPLTILNVVKTDEETKIKYKFAGQTSTATIKDTVTHVSLNMKSTRDANKTLSELLYKYEQEETLKGNLLIQHDPVFIDNEGMIRVGYDCTGIDVPKTIKLLRDFFPISANPRAFLSALSYNLIGTLAYNIMVNAPAGYLFPIRISSGQTGGAKTSTDAIFVIKGFDQDKDEGFLTNEQVATAFTFEKNMGDSALPVIINDVDPSWLTKVSTLLKNSSENPTAGDRGNADQTITRRRMKRALNITTNEVIIPSDDSATTRRYILEGYTEEHVKRCNPTAFRAFMNSLPDGFMFALFREIFNGAAIADITKDIAKTEDACAFVNYGLGLINSICEKYGIEKFPVYTASTNYGADSFSEFVEWLEAQWFRLNQTDDNGRLIPPYPEISKSEIDVDETSNSRVFWFTGAAYKVAQRKLNLRHRTVTALFSNYVENDYIQLAATNKFHKFSGVAGRGFALRVLKEH